MAVISEEPGLTIQDALLLSAAVHILKSIDIADRATAQELDGMAQRLEDVVENSTNPADRKLPRVS